MSPGVKPRTRRRRIEPLVALAAGRLGLSSSQAYTVLTGVALAMVLAVTSLPPVLDHSRGFHAPGSDVAVARTPEPLVGPAESDQADRTDRTDRTDLGSGAAPVTTTPSDPARDDIPDQRPPSRPQPAGESDLADPFADIEPGRTSVFTTVEEPGVPSGVAIGPDGTIWVVTDNAATQGGAGPSAILAFDPDGTPLRRWEVPDQPQNRLQGLTGVAVTADDRVWVTDASTARVLRLDPSTGTIDVVATIPDVPPCLLGLVQDRCESGLVDLPPDLRAVLAWEHAGVLVADQGQGIVWTVAPDGTVDVAVSLEDRLPGNGPTGLGRDRDGSLVLAVSARLLSLPPGLASVVRVRLDPTGRPQEPEVILDLDVGQTPAHLAVGDSGRIYLAAADVVLDIGGEHDVIHHTGAGVEPAFDGPTGVALRHGSLLVTNRAALGPASSWVVFAIDVFDQPSTHQEVP